MGGGGHDWVDGIVGGKGGGVKIFFSNFLAHLRGGGVGEGRGSRFIVLSICIYIYLLAISWYSLFFSNHVLF
jgi:hypothetical protein